jgi:hypothetical protein
MASSTENPAGAESAGLGNVNVWAGSDFPRDTAANSNPQVVHFDYSILDAEKRTLAQTAANLIRASVKRQLGEVIGAGKQLQLVKDALDHGQFLAWLAAEFSFSERTAQRYMRAAEVYGDINDIMSDLPQGVLYELQAASVPAACRDRIISRRKAGEPLGEKEIKEAIARARVLMRRERAANGGRRKEHRRKPARKKSKAECVTNVAELLDQLEREEAQEKAATEKAVALLVHKLGPDLIELQAHLKHANFRAVFEAVLKVPNAEDGGSL